MSGRRLADLALAGLGARGLDALWHPEGPCGCHLPTDPFPCGYPNERECRGTAWEKDAKGRFWARCPGESPPTLGEAVEAGLAAGGLDGLWNAYGGCGCLAGGLFPCGYPSEHCEGGYRVPCVPGECEEDHPWHVAASRERVQGGTIGERGWYPPYGSA